MAIGGKREFARVLYVGVPFVLANRSDVVLHVRQRSHDDGALLPLHATKPFSWHSAGARQLMCRVVCRLSGLTSQWSAPFNITLASERVISCTVPDAGTTYQLAVAVHQLDAQSRIVVVKKTSFCFVH